MKKLYYIPLDGVFTFKEALQKAILGWRLPTVDELWRADSLLKARKPEGGVFWSSSEEEDGSGRIRCFSFDLGNEVAKNTTDKMSVMLVREAAE